MKVSTNNIGNYSVQQFQKNIEKKLTLAKEEELNNDEKNFFISRYPQKKDDIVDYHFYQKSGKMSGVKIGHLYDKRG